MTEPLEETCKRPDFMRIEAESGYHTLERLMTIYNDYIVLMTSTTGVYHGSTGMVVQRAELEQYLRDARRRGA